MNATASIPAPRPDAWPWTLARVALGAATVMTPLLLLLLVGRRLAGGLTPPPGGLLIGIGLGAAVAAWGWRQLWRRLAARLPGAVPMERYYPPVMLALLLVALALPGVNGWALGLLGLFFLGGEIAAGYGVGRAGELAPGETAVREGARSAAEPENLEPDELEEEEHDLCLPAGVSQQVTRSSERGEELLDCVLRAGFAVGQRQETLHVAFCPPLWNAPMATCEILDGPPCEVKITALETFGARLELKRQGTLALADEAIVRLRVRGTAPT